MNTSNVVRRAAAEGFDKKMILAAMVAVQADGEASAETAGVYEFNEAVSLVELARRIAGSTYYAGGFMYPGTDFGHALRRFQPTMHSRPGESDDAADEAVIVAALASLPIGTEVVETTDFGRGAEYDYYRRTADGLVYYMRDSEQDREFYRRQDHRCPVATAAKIGVACSNTFMALYMECL